MSLSRCRAGGSNQAMVSFIPMYRFLLAFLNLLRCTTAKGSYCLNETSLKSPRKVIRLVIFGIEYVAQARKSRERDGLRGGRTKPKRWRALHLSIRCKSERRFSERDRREIDRLPSTSSPARAKTQAAKTDARRVKPSNSARAFNSRSYQAA